MPRTQSLTSNTPPSANSQSFADPLYHKPPSCLHRGSRIRRLLSSRESGIFFCPCPQLDAPLPAEASRPCSNHDSRSRDRVRNDRLNFQIAQTLKWAAWGPSSRFRPSVLHTQVTPSFHRVGLFRRPHTAMMDFRARVKFSSRSRPLAFQSKEKGGAGSPLSCRNVPLSQRLQRETTPTRRVFLERRSDSCKDTTYLWLEINTLRTSTLCVMHRFSLCSENRLRRCAAASRQHTTSLYF
ncbi:hypothetical protein BJX61DRAFT_124247 [Aspergillus egyptiacus]|nr:hypothetical protein BJX61DRAFT_124247 [Aspergillus egyptiacus]